MKDFDEMTLEELIESQQGDDIDRIFPETGVLLLGNTSPEWFEADLDFDGPVPRGRLPVEARPRRNGLPSEVPASGWFPKMRTGTFGQKKGCKTHGMEFWQAPESGSQPYCRKCRAERYYARAEAEGRKPRESRRYA